MVPFRHQKLTESNILILRNRMTTLEALLHICIYTCTHIHSTEATHTSFMCVC